MKLELLVPLLTFVAMVVVGLDVRRQDMMGLRVRKRMLLAAVVIPPLFHPWVTIGVTWLLKTEPVVAQGLLLLAVTPGAAMANLYTFLARGNVALSVAMCAVSSLLCVITMPLGLAVLGRMVSGADPTALELPARALATQLLLLMVAPITLGVVLRVLISRQSDGELLIARMKRIGLVAVASIVGLVLYEGIAGGKVTGVSGSFLPAALLLTVIWLIAGVAVSALLTRDRRDRAALLLQFCTRNVAIASAISLGQLARLDLAVIVVAFLVVQLPVMVGFAVWFGRSSSTVTPVPGRSAELEPAP